MNYCKRSSLLFAISISFFLSSLNIIPGTSQTLQEGKYLDPGYYVVVGVFGVHKNAINFTAYVKGIGEDAEYALYPPKNMYYVQIGKYGTHDKARIHAHMAREMTSLDSTWVFKAMPFTLADGTKVGEGIAMDKGVGVAYEVVKDTANITHIAADSSASSAGILVGSQIIRIEGELVAGVNLTKSEIDERILGVGGSQLNLTILRNGEIQSYSLTRSEIKEMVDKREIVLEIKNDTAFVSRISGPDPFESGNADSLNKPTGINELDDFKGVKMYFNTYTKGTFQEIPGKIEVIDPDKLKRYGYKEAHKVVDIPRSISRSGNVQLIADIFGYKKVQQDFNLMDSLNERTSPFLSYEDSVLIVDFELQRYSTGDVITMYNVYFYKDAAIMRPESKYEVQQLLAMLNENNDYKIMIMGHTNGNNFGPIIEMEPGSKTYFSNSVSKKESRGSAKKLSLLRAELIRSYLLSEGVRQARIEAKGFGGKKSIYKKFDPLAYKNVRVEIKILAE